MDSLPSKISYSLVEIESPKGKKLMIPRRELFDVRLQLMAEDDADSSAPTGLDDSDIKTNVYEGGYKSWECSIDLAKLLLDRGPRKDIDDLCRVDHVIEVRNAPPSFKNIPLEHIADNFQSSAVAPRSPLSFSSTTRSRNHSLSTLPLPTTTRRCCDSSPSPTSFSRGLRRWTAPIPPLHPFQKTHPTLFTTPRKAMVTSTSLRSSPALSSRRSLLAR